MADLAILTYYVSLSNSQNMQDVNIFSEALFGKLLSVLYHGEFKDLNTFEDTNFPGIDLGSDELKICVQVTSDDTRAKIVKTIEVFEGNNHFDRFTNLKVLIIKLEKRRFNRGDFKTNGKYDFDCKKDVITVKSLLDDIQKLTQDEQEQIRQILTDNLATMPKPDEETLEMFLFKKLFRAIADNVDMDEVKAEAERPEVASLDIKKERFKQFWDLIQQNYAEIIDTKREARYEQAYNSFDASEKTAVREYLRLQSRKALALNDRNPVKAIEWLKDKMIKEFQLNFVSETDAEYFLYYQLYNCSVFPND